MNENSNVPYIAYESSEAKNERIIKRLIVALIISIALMFVTNIFWIHEFCGFDYTTEETTVEADSGTANYIGQDGDITYGENNGTKEDVAEMLAVTVWADTVVRDIHRLAIWSRSFVIL